MIIDHGDGWLTGYYHMPSPLVSEGQIVVAGQQLGSIGNDTSCGGVSYGPHVHFFVKYVVGGYAAMGDPFRTTKFDVDLQAGQFGGWVISGRQFAACATYAVSGERACAVTGGQIFNHAASHTAAIARYYDGHQHWVTSSAVPSQYNLESVLGYFDPNPDPGTTAVYGCASSGGHFLSTSGTCESQSVLGIEGYMYAAAPQGGIAVFRCRNGTDHFASTDPRCEGTVPEGQLGWASPEANLSRFYSTSIGDHWLTGGTPPQPSSYGFEEVMGWMSWSANRPIYGCQVGNDHMLSLDRGCEGQVFLGTEGKISSTFAGMPGAIALYRCRIGSDHFASTQAGCEGQVLDGLLGYIGASITPGR